MFMKEVFKVLFIISYLKEVIFNWMQFRVENYFDNEKND